MNLRLLILQLLLTSTFVSMLHAQSYEVANSVMDQSISQQDTIVPEPKKRNINEGYDGNWSIGIGVNALDDSGKQFSDFNINEYWNFSMPFTFSVEYFNNGMFSFALMASYNEYVAGKNIDDTGLIIEGFEADYLAVDFSTKFYTRDFFHASRMDPYLFLGFGYTNISAYKLEPFPENDMREDLDHISIDEDGNYDIPDIGRLTGNGGLGFNYWFSHNLAFNLNIAWKIGIPIGDYESGPNSVSNQIQYSFGILYLFN